MEAPEALEHGVCGVFLRAIRVEFLTGEEAADAFNRKYARDAAERLTQGLRSPPLVANDFFKARFTEAVEAHAGSSGAPTTAGGYVDLSNPSLGRKTSAAAAPSLPMQLGVPPGFAFAAPQMAPAAPSFGFGMPAPQSFGFGGAPSLPSSPGFGSQFIDESRRGGFNRGGRGGFGARGGGPRR